MKLKNEQYGHSKQKLYAWVTSLGVTPYRTDNYFYKFLSPYLKALTCSFIFLIGGTKW
jgi:hypothetical protein